MHSRWFWTGHKISDEKLTLAVWQCVRDGDIYTFVPPLEYLHIHFTLCTSKHQSVNNKYALLTLFGVLQNVNNFAQILFLPLTLSFCEPDIVHTSSCLCVFVTWSDCARKYQTGWEDILLMYTSLLGPPGPQCTGVGRWRVGEGVR